MGLMLLLVGIMMIFSILCVNIINFLVASLVVYCELCKQWIDDRRKESDLINLFD